MGLRLLPGVPRGPALKALTRLRVPRSRLHSPGIHRLLHHCATTSTALGFHERVDPQSLRSTSRRTKSTIYRNMNRSVAGTATAAESRAEWPSRKPTTSAFADEHYAQLQDVFAKQGLVPTYGVARVRLLIRHLQPTGNLLLLRARDAEGHCAATGIFFGMNRHAYFWGNASWRSSQTLCAQRSAALVRDDVLQGPRRDGVRNGRGGPTRKNTERSPPSNCGFASPSIRWIASARNLAASTFWLYQRVAGAGKRKASQPPGGEGRLVCQWSRPLKNDF